MDSILQQARVLTELNRHAEAEPLLARVLAADPGNEDALIMLGGALWEQQRYTDAERTVARLLASNPDNAPAWALMARLLYRLGRRTDSLDAARKAVALEPHWSWGLVTLAELLNRIFPGSPEALALLERVVEEDPLYTDAYLEIGRIYLSIQRWEKSEHWLLEGLRYNHDDAYAILWLGLVRGKLGRFDESRDDVREALRTNPKTTVLEHVLDWIEAFGIPDHLLELYRMVLDTRGKPDVSRPGAAGSDPILLALQGELAMRMLHSRYAQEAHARAGQLAAAVLTRLPSDPNARFVHAHIFA